MNVANVETFNSRTKIHCISYTARIVDRYSDRQTGRRKGNNNKERTGKSNGKYNLKRQIPKSWRQQYRSLSALIYIRRFTFIYIHFIIYSDDCGRKNLAVIQMKAEKIVTITENDFNMFAILLQSYLDITTSCRSFIFKHKGKPVILLNHRTCLPVHSILHNHSLISLEFGLFLCDIISLFVPLSISIILINIMDVYLWQIKV